MQKLNRFVTYIYSYRDSQRDTNVGFAKVDSRGGIVRLEIQIRKKIKETKEAQICLLAGTPTQPEAIPIGVMKFEKETGIYKGRFSASELGGSTYTFEQVTGLYIKGERELFASQWTQEEIRIAGVRVLAVEEKPEEGTSQEKHLQEEGMPREQMQQRGIQREQMQQRGIQREQIQQGGIAREQMQGASQGTDFQEKHQQQKGILEEYQQKQQTTEAQPETLQTESLQRRQRQGRQRREQPESPTLRATEAEPQYDWRYEWEKLDKSPGNELVFGLALWTRNKGKP